MKNKLWIAHRGCTQGIDRRQNHPDFIKEAHNKMFDVEIDIRYIDGKYWLGHDGPEYDIGADLYDFWESRSVWYGSLWFHCKDIPTMYQVMNLPQRFNCFIHDRDDAALVYTGTHNTWLWTLMGKPLTNNSIAVLPEQVEHWEGFHSCAGYCSDFIEEYKNGRLPKEGY